MTIIIMKIIMKDNEIKIMKNENNDNNNEENEMIMKWK